MRQASSINFKAFGVLTRKTMVRLSLLVILLLSALFQVQVQANSFQLSQAAHLTLRDNVKRNWLPPIANPTNKSQYFLASRAGELFVLDDNILQNKALLNFTEKLATSGDFKLTAFTLHPNFSLANEKGTNTFYTAHNEPKRETESKRLTDGDASYTFEFDAVITEWVLGSNSASTSSRELMRIALPSLISGVTQLSFNKNVTKWQDSFGQLYAVLPKYELYKSLSLYSGAILRIHPEVSGLHDYTIPANNPFTKDLNINDELLLIGGQKIDHITWYKNNSKQIVITHQYDEKTQISLAEHIHDWRTTKPKEVLFSDEENLASQAYFYQGSTLKTLKDKLLFLKRNAKEWELHTTHPKDLKQSVLSTTSSKIEWAISAYQIPVKNKIGIFSDHNNEVLLLDYSDNVLFTVKANTLIKAKPAVNKEPVSLQATVESVGSPAEKSFELKLPNWIEPSTLKRYLIALVALSLFILISYLIRHKVKTMIRKVIREKFSRFEMSEDEQLISIFKREKVEPSETFKMEDIQKIKINLNNEELFSLNKDDENNFTHEHEKLLTVHFKDEYQNKMFEDSIRTIDLIIIDNNQKNYAVFAYLRKGNQRLTHGRYFDIVANLLDLCWKISASAHTDDASSRHLKNIENLDMQARPSKNKIPNKPAKEPARKVTPPKSKTPSKSKAEHTESKQEELVDALDKLVTMRQQGLLTEQEFTLAKEKLLA